MLIMNKGFFQYLAWLTIGYALLALASWCDDVAAMSSPFEPFPDQARAVARQRDRMADRYAQAVYDRVALQHPQEQPQEVTRLFLEALADEYDGGKPDPATCTILTTRINRNRTCIDYYWPFWRSYRNLEEQD